MGAVGDGEVEYATARVLKGIAARQPSKEPNHRILTRSFLPLMLKSKSNSLYLKTSKAVLGPSHSQGTDIKKIEIALQW
jgi:hypothetical protein